jgi:adenine-specific DNA-methyltransferase
MPFLDWVNKNQAKEATLAVPYHLLNRDSVHGDAAASAENLLIQGDNLLALKALMPFYAGRVKCIFIDPPYNTQSAFEHYDDRLEHSQWLSMMYPRLVLLRELLAADGSIWVTVDDNEAHYLKVLLDEVFGRGNFVANVIWQKRIGPDNRLPLGDAHDHILVFAVDKKRFQARANQIPLTAKQIAEFKNPDNDPRGPWTSSSNFSAQGYRPNQMYKITTPAGVEHSPPQGRCWVTVESEYQRLLSEGRMWFGSDGRGMPRKKTYLNEQKGRMSWTWWPNDEVGNTQESKKEIIALYGAEDIFDTPKPERLISRILHIATNPGELVLDSFLGSGTTAAVAHKMGRQYIGIEMGEHALTHCLPRLEKVIAGEQGGVSEAVGWQGGGGFSFLTLGEPAFDEHGRLNPAVNFRTLAAYVWHTETGSPGYQEFDSPLLGMHEGRAYFLLYNGILGDRRPAGGNVLTSEILAHIRQLCPSPMPVVVYGEMTRLGPSRMSAAGVTFKQIPYDISER